MADRRQQVLLLLESRDDGLWFPSGRATESGFVPGVIERCEPCAGSGSVADRFGRRTRCARCAGVGRVAFDRMDSLGLRVGSSATASTAAPRRRVRCDRCDGEGVWKGDRCELCGGEGSRDLHVFELAVDVREAGCDPLTASVVAREAGSYRELERALAELGGFARRVLFSEVDAGRRPLGSGAEVSLEALIVAMPDPIRVPAAVVAGARERRLRRTRARGRGSDVRALAVRDREIRGFVGAGRPVQWVAGEYGLSVARVYEIVNGSGS